MALLNSESYGDLAKVSSGGSKRAPGKFFSIFICGDVRPGQEYGKMQCMPSIDGGEYFIQNAGTIYFIPYFIKRYWEKTLTTKSKEGKDYSKLVGFGWGDDIPKIDDSCKYAYTIAGLALDPSTKKALLHSKDIEDAGIKKGDPILIHFKCGGMKFNGAMKFIDALTNKAKTLPPLSNSPEFEKLVVTPKRFITTATVAIAESKHGNKHVFQFVPETQLPDKAVEQVMNSAKGLTADFEKQFDKTALVKSGVASTQSSDTESSGGDSVPFEVPSQPENKPESSTPSGNNFDLGI
jgi:hypothetical protein